MVYMTDVRIVEAPRLSPAITFAQIEESTRVWRRKPAQTAEHPHRAVVCSPRSYLKVLFFTLWGTMMSIRVCVWEHECVVRNIPMFVILFARLCKFFFDGGFVTSVCEREPTPACWIISVTLLLLFFCWWRINWIDLVCTTLTLCITCPVEFKYLRGLWWNFTRDIIIHFHMFIPNNIYYNYFK